MSWRCWGAAVGLAMGIGMGMGLAVSQGIAEPVSFSREVSPIMDRSCVACHQPSKLKGKLDLSSFSALSAGGKHGPAVTARKPENSRLLTQVRGPKPEMPPEGKPLTESEVAILERWISEGAVDDSASATAANREPIRYEDRPVISSLAWSPDGTRLAVPGNGEVFLFDVRTWELERRLRGEGSRVESVQFSPDGTRLAVAAGTPSRFGEIQIWETQSGALQRVVRVGPDSVFGLAWSPDGTRVAVGGADRTLRMVEVSSGRELICFDQHTDWVLGACFTGDGSKLISAGRDRSMKLIESGTGRLIDEICRPNEPLLAALVRPGTELVAAVGGEYRIRVYRAKPRSDTQDANADPNYVREYDGFEGGMTAAAYSRDGVWIATAGASTGEVRVHDAENSSRKATLRGHDGVVFGLAFNPDGSRLATAGFDGLVRVYDWKREMLLTVLSPVPPPIASKDGPSGEARKHQE